MIVKQHRWSVYIALLADDSYYVGITHHEPVVRLHRHRSGFGSAHVARLGIVKILWTEGHQSALSARRREQQLKRWTRAKKEALIRGDVPTLKRLARPPRER